LALEAVVEVKGHRPAVVWSSFEVRGSIIAARISQGRFESKHLQKCSATGFLKSKARYAPPLPGKAVENLLEYSLYREWKILGMGT
jgi:hypothetical protein